MDAFRSTSFRVVLPQRVSSFLSNFIVCKSWNPCRKLSTTSTSENYSPYAQRVLSLTRDPGRQFLTKGGKKKPKFKPRPLCVGNNDLNTQWRSIYNKHRTWLPGVCEISMTETESWASVSQRFCPLCVCFFFFVCFVLFLFFFLCQRTFNE